MNKKYNSLYVIAIICLLLSSALFLINGYDYKPMIFLFFGLISITIYIIKINQ